MVNNSIAHIEENLSFIDQHVLAEIKNKYEIKFNRLQKTDLPGNINLKTEDVSKKIFNQFNQVQLDLIAVERETMKQLHKEGKAQEEVIRKIERELDFEEERIRMDFYDH
jgi:CPA1 family monovalent cation:H+ antiporter